MLQSCIWSAKSLFLSFRNLSYKEFTAHMSTIYAVSSGMCLFVGYGTFTVGLPQIDGQGKCGVAVIRVSGPQAASAVMKIGDLMAMPLPRRAILRKFRDPITREVLDRGLLIWFPGPNSFSGEDSTEFQVHGGYAVVSAMLGALSKIEGFRPAEPGEFTRRAFHNGKVDLTEVEGLADLIHAETEAQRRQALLQADGSLSRLYRQWRQTLIKSVGNIEAYIDFSEDENIEPEVVKDVEAAVRRLIGDIEGHLVTAQCGERLRDGVRTSIVGEPNAGKSSLLNALCARPAAIVSPIPGTTRDVIEMHLSVGGFPVVVADTAGLRNNPADDVEGEGIARAHAHAELADIVVLVMDATKYVNWAAKRDTPNWNEFLSETLTNLNMDRVLKKSVVNSENSLRNKTQDGDGFVTNEQNGRQVESESREVEVSGNAVNSANLQDSGLIEDKCLIVLNKIDLVENFESLKYVFDEHANVMGLSCKTEDGLQQFTSKLIKNLEQLCGGSPGREHPTLCHARHRHHLSACAACLRGYLALQHDDVVLAAHQLRKALRNIGSITGHVSTEQILDVIFRDFCIGK